MRSGSGSRPTGRVRIVGGRWRRQWLEVADVGGLRPSPDALRETLFNWLSGRLHGPILDAFAGTGALGFEAASRGSPVVHLLEPNAVAYAALQRSQARLLGGRAAAAGGPQRAQRPADLGAEGDRLPDLRLEASDALAWLDARLGSGLDVPLIGLFLDPPFRHGLIDAVVARLPALEAAGVVLPRAWIYVEQEIEAPLPSIPGRVLARERRHGETHGMLFLPEVE